MESNTDVVPQVDEPKRSYSQLNSWLECGQRYRLERILKVPQRPDVWRPAGTAIHAVIERFLRQKIEEGQ